MRFYFVNFRTTQVHAAKGYLGFSDPIDQPFKTRIAAKRKSGTQTHGR